MKRSDQAALGVAAAGHAALFALLSAGFLQAPEPFEQPPAMTVSLVEDVAVAATAPPAVEPPAPSVAPDPGPPEDAAPPEADPEPAPPLPRPVPPNPVAPSKVAPPLPAPPKPTPPRPAPPRPAPPKPATVVKPDPAARPKPVVQPAPARATPPRTVAAVTRPSARPAAKGTGTQVASNQARPRGAILGNDFLKGLSADRTAPAAKGQAPVAATLDGKARADIGSAITRQVQPCADRQIVPGPGAEKIRVDIRLSINRDGSLAARPQVVGRAGVDDGNARYVDRVEDLAIATFIGCAPLRGLPADLYAVPGGWRLFTLRYKLPG